MAILRLTDARLELPYNYNEESTDQHVCYEIPFEEVDAIRVVLDDFPEEDLAGFNQKYAHTQSQYSRVCSILIHAKREMKYWKEKRSKMKIILRRERNNILASDLSIQKLRNKELQEAAMYKHLESVSDVIDELSIIIDNLEADIDILAVKKSEIESANTNLSRQQRVVEAMMSLNVPIGIYKMKGSHNG